MPGVDATGLVAAAERIRMPVANSWPDHAGTRLRLTASIGATLARPGESPGDLVDPADRLMHQSKRAGRNQVTTTLDGTDDAHCQPAVGDDPRAPGSAGA